MAQLTATVADGPSRFQFLIQLRRQPGRDVQLAARRVAVGRAVGYAEGAGAAVATGPVRAGARVALGLAVGTSPVGTGAGVATAPVRAGAGMALGLAAGAVAARVPVVLGLAAGAVAAGVPVTLGDAAALDGCWLA